MHHSEIYILTYNNSSLQGKMECYCFENILSAKLGPSNNTQEFLEIEQQLCSNLYWEINKHDFLQHTVLLFKENRLNMDNVLEHFQMFKVKKGTCFKKKFCSDIYHELYKRHYIALSVLENEVNRTEQPRLHIPNHRTFSNLMMGDREIKEYIKVVKKYLRFALPEEKYLVSHFNKLQLEIEKYLHTLKLIQLFFNFQDCKNGV